MASYAAKVRYAACRVNQHRHRGPEGLRHQGDETFGITAAAVVGAPLQVSKPAFVLRLIHATTRKRQATIPATQLGIT